MTYSLNMTNITKTFGTGSKQVTALNQLKFTASPGEFISIIGPSGSEKRTFLTLADYNHQVVGQSTLMELILLMYPKKKELNYAFKKLVLFYKVQI